MRLLITTDFSDTANKALDFALSNFNHETSEIILVNAVIPRFAGSTMGIDLELELTVDARNRMKQLEKELLSDYPDLKVMTFVKLGNLITVIDHISKEIQPDFIIMGTNGVTGVYEKLLGSNTEEIMKTIEYPLIVVPIETIDLRINKIVLSLENGGGLEKPISKCLALCKLWGCELNILHFYNDSLKEDIIQVHPSLLFGINYTIDNIPFTEGNLEDHIIAHAYKVKAGLITVIPTHKAFLKNLFHHSVASNLLDEAPVPMLFL